VAGWRAVSLEDSLASETVSDIVGSVDLGVGWEKTLKHLATA
jgi:hypothetical protein